jgi:hypothetical protein
MYAFACWKLTEQAYRPEILTAFGNVERLIVVSSVWRPGIGYRPNFPQVSTLDQDNWIGNYTGFTLGGWKALLGKR